jgi:ERF superfamily protein
MSENQSASINELAKALVNAQAEIRGAVKDSKNPFFQSNYADLESVWDACRDPLIKNGLAVAQTTDSDALGDYLITTLMHISGQWLRGKYKLTPVKNDPQSHGSALTYGRRYTLAAIVGVHQTDDDAEAAQGRHKAAPETKPTPLVAPAKLASVNPVKKSGPTEGERLQAEEAAFDAPVQDLPQPAPVKKTGPSEKQLKLCWARTKSIGLNNDEAAAFLKKHSGHEHSADWTRADFDRVLNALDAADAKIRAADAEERG